MKKRFCAMMLAMVLAVVCFTGCTGGTTDVEKVEATTEATVYPLTITDDLGNTVTFESEPQKVLSLSPANTEIIGALDCVDKMVGRTDYCDYPEEVLAVESIGDYYAPNAEKIISLQPDVVLAAEYMQDDLKAQLEGAGIVVYICDPITVDEVEQTILKMGQILNKNAEAGDVVAEMETERTELVALCQTAETQRSVFIDLGDYYSSGDGSVQDAMLSELNVINIAAGTGDHVPQLSTEQIIADDPDVYISLYTDLETLKAVPGFSALSAFKNDMVYTIDANDSLCSIMSRPGPRIVEGMREFAERIYPELF